MSSKEKMKAYRGDQSVQDWLNQKSQVLLFDDDALKRLTVVATRTVEELGREHDLFELSETVKTRAARKGIYYNSGLVTLALDAAMRIRQR